MRTWKQISENEAIVDTGTHEIAQDCYTCKTKPILKQLTVACLQEAKNNVKRIS